MNITIKDILGSIRFWQLVAIGALQALVGVGAISGEGFVAVVDAIKLVLGGSVVIGSADSVATRVGNRK